jgi:hypothetical protein
VQENGKTLGPKDSEQLTALLAHHADADAKSKDVDHFTVGPHPTFASKCFIIVRKDGTKVRVRSALVHLLLPCLGFGSTSLMGYSGLAWFCLFGACVVRVGGPLFFVTHFGVLSLVCRAQHMLACEG